MYIFICLYIHIHIYIYIYVYYIYIFLPRRCTRRACGPLSTSERPRGLDVFVSSLLVCLKKSLLHRRGWLQWSLSPSPPLRTKGRKAGKIRGGVRGLRDHCNHSLRYLQETGKSGYKGDLFLFARTRAYARARFLVV